MLETVQGFVSWLAETPPSLLIQNVAWIIPLTQTIHIICIAIVTAALALIDFRLLGAGPRSQSVSDLVSRHMPWVWVSLVVLLISGSILIIGEPARSLMNPGFILKMTMLLCVIVINLTLQNTVKRDVAFWELSPERRNAARLMALASLVLLVAIIFAGRWIAYLESYGS
jgi:magnesium-transporting ATPase (P-type)